MNELEEASKAQDLYDKILSRMNGKPDEWWERVHKHVAKETNCRSLADFRDAAPMPDQIKLFRQILIVILEDPPVWERLEKISVPDTFVLPVQVQLIRRGIQLDLNEVSKRICNKLEPLIREVLLEVLTEK